MKNGEPDPEEAKISRDRGFHHRWPVDESYKIVDGIIRPLSNGEFVEDLIPWRDAPECYYPIGRLEIPGEFAKLENGSEKEIMTFVKRYGLLGYRQVVESNPHRYSRLFYWLQHAAEEGRMVNPCSLLQLHKNDAADMGDPLDWILGHAGTVNLVLRLAGSLKSGTIRQEMDKYKVRRPETDEDETRFEFYIGDRVTPTIGSCDFYNDPCQTAMQVITMVLSANLTGVRRSLYVDCPHRNKRGAIEPIFQFNCLLDCIYWLVADAVLGKAIRKCYHCKRYFVASNARRKYCPPRKGNLGVSTCANVRQVTLSRRRKKDRERTERIKKSQKPRRKS